MNINALKYTSPTGQVSYVNPMDNEAVRTLGSGGGGSSSGGGGSSGGYLDSIGYTLPSIFMARGGLVKKPDVAVIGERGTEMVLPANITSTILSLTDMGFSQMKGGREITIYPADIILDGRKIGQAVFTAGTERMRAKGLSIR